MEKVTLSSLRQRVSSPFCTSIMAFPVARKGLPKIKGTAWSPSIFNTTKFIGKMKSSITLTRMSSTIPVGYDTDFSAICRVMVVDFKVPIFNFSKKESGIRLMLAQGSHKAFLTWQSPTVQAIATLPGSFILAGSFLCIIALQLSIKLTVSYYIHFFF